MVGNIILIFLLLPLYALMIYSYFYPEESFLFGKRWQFKEKPEISEEGIIVLKYVSIIGILFLTMVLVFSLSDNYAFRIAVFIIFILYIIIRGLKLIPK